MISRFFYRENDKLDAGKIAAKQYRYEPNEELSCSEREPEVGFTCTRGFKHEGPHVAHNGLGDIAYAMWGQGPVILADMTATDDQLQAYLHEVQNDIDKAIAESEAANSRARHLLDTGNEIIAELRRRAEKSFLKGESK